MLRSLAKVVSTFRESRLRRARRRKKFLYALCSLRLAPIHWFFPLESTLRESKHIRLYTFELASSILEKTAKTREGRKKKAKRVKKEKGVLASVLIDLLSRVLSLCPVYARSAIQ